MALFHLLINHKIRINEFISLLKLAAVLEIERQQLFD
jgi:hypothetical protein